MPNDENVKSSVVSEKVLEAIAALKDKAVGDGDGSVREGVDLEGIVKKLTRNRSKGRSK